MQLHGLILWHLSIGVQRTGQHRHCAGALAHIAVDRFVDRNHHLYATLQALGCNLWDTTERETVSTDGWMTREIFRIMFFFIGFGGLLHCSDVMFLLIAPTHHDELNCTA